MIILASAKAFQLHEQINPLNADKTEDSLIIENVKSIFSVVDEWLKKH